MVDITEASDADISTTVDAFSAALQAKSVDLKTVRLQRILLAVDQSNQGETAERFAAALAANHRAEVLLLYAYEGERDAARERYLEERAQALSRAGVRLVPHEAPVRTAHGLRAFEQIDQTSSASGCDLVVMPAPYLDDYAKLGAESVGATLDVLAGRARLPLLAIRAPEAEPKTCLSNALLPITPCGDATIEAAAWTVALVQRGGAIKLLAIGDDELAVQAAKEGGGPEDSAFDPEKLAGLRTPAAAGLVAALQRRSAHSGVRTRVVVQGGDAVEKVVKVANNEECLLVLPVTREAGGASNALQIVRCSRNPVLIVAA